MLQSAGFCKRYNCHLALNNLLRLSSRCRPFRYGAVLPAFTILLSPAGPVFGQEGAATLEEVVVTAQKREQSLQDVPISVSVFSEKAIENLNAGDFSDFADTVPGLGYATLGAGSSSYIIRGIGQVGLGLSPTTGVYMDEVPLQSRNGRAATVPDPRLFDVARVEVLRGPQGVIFGSSTLGGMVRIVTNQPDASQFEGSLDAGIATIKDGAESWDIKGMVNIPLVDNKLALRVVGTTGYEGGWIDEVRAVTSDVLANADNPEAIREDINSNDYHMVRALLAYTPDETLTITPSILYQESRQDVDRASADETFGFESQRRARYQDTFVDVDMLSLNLNIEKDLDFAGGASLLSSTSYLDWSFSNQFDSTVFRSGQIASIVGPSPNGELYWSGSNNDTDTQQLTQEIRLTSTSDSSPWEYITGLYYNDIQQDDRQSRPSNNLFGAAAPLPFGASSPPQLEEQLADFEQQEVAAFGQITYKPSDQWTLSLGGRAFRYEQTDSRSRYGVGGRAGGDLRFQFSDKTEESGFIPRFTASYQPTDAVNLYAGYSVGFRTGGVNRPFSDDCTAQELAAAGLPDSPPPFESDTTENLELGAKTNWFDNRMKLDVAVYSIDWKDFQQSVIATCGAQSQFIVSYIGNAGEVESQGAELEFSLAPHQDVLISGGVSYTDAVYKEAFTTLGLAAGSSLLDVPKLTANLRGEYRFPVGQHWLGNLMLSANYVDDTVTGFGEGEPLPRPAYTILDLMARLEIDSLSISLFVDNLTDETPIYAKEFANNPFSTNAPSFFAAVVGQPRTIGLRLSKRFD